MKVLRTPDDRFDDLPEFGYEPSYADVGGLRMHFVDEGQQAAQPVLMLHGEPTWSFLYRKVIPPVAEAGFRAIAPDLIGFGRSDKPVLREEHSYRSHVDWMWNFIEALGLDNVVLVCHDWGGLIGLRLVAEHPSRFAAVLASNTFMPTGDIPVPPEFLRWQAYSQNAAEFHPGALVNRGCLVDLGLGVIAAYDAPFPDDTFKAAPRIFPSLVPVSPDDPASAANRKAWQALAQWDRPFMTAFSDSDPITRGGDLYMHPAIPGAKGMPHRTIENAGHFVQEDAPEDFTAAVLDLLRLL